MKILLQAGGCSGLVNAAPLWSELRRHSLPQPMLACIEPPGERELTERFLSDLQLPRPHVRLIGGPENFRRIEPVLARTRPDLMLLMGDADTSLAWGLAAARLGIPVGRLEAGVRRCDRPTATEIKNLLLSSLAEFLFVDQVSALHHLLGEGVEPRRIHVVGSVTIDAMLSNRERWKRSAVLARLRVPSGQPYAWLAIDNVSGMDWPGGLHRLFASLQTLSRRLPVLLPVHPGTRPRLLHQAEVAWWDPETSGTRLPAAGMFCVAAPGYLDGIALMSHARLVMTDSIDAQQATAILGVPCLTLRETVELTAACDLATRRSTGIEPGRVPATLDDGRAAARIVKIILSPALRAGTASALPSPLVSRA